MELAGHDHWQDLRAVQDGDTAYRGLLVAQAISVNRYNMPGFNTLKLSGDTDEFIAKDLEETIVDISPTLGMSELPEPDSLPRYTLKYSDFGFEYLTPETIISTISGWWQLEDSSIINRFLSEKLGYNTNDHSQFEEGLSLSAENALITSGRGHYSDDLPFVC